MRDHKKTYVTTKFNFHYIMEGQFVYMVVCGNEVEQKLPFAFLNEIKTEWWKKYTESQCIEAPSYAMSIEFEPQLKTKMIYFSGGSAAKINKLKANVDEVTEIMLDNVDKILKRGEDLEHLSERTKELESQSNSFMKDTNKLKRKKCKEYIKWQFIVLYLCICCCLSIYPLLLLICGGYDLPTCVDWFET
eukprot:TRINITY_DN15163_c0_g1_i1.p1 TRINITY_DN15163_c0_g1~~TRINITY_DN15163_c0_g1_i1.p1  ORF type:complete len:190 (+),score=20.86 TRINITY_DN15163_c0_g1_i1:213-782(+)